MKARQFKGQVYFHVLKESRRLCDGRLVKPGHTYHALKSTNRVDYGGPIHCCFGMHASNGLWIDAHKNYWVCLVRLWEKLDYPDGYSKGVAMRRHVIAMRKNTSERSIAYKFGLRPTAYEDHFFAYGEGNMQRVVNWILKKPYLGIVSSS